MRDFPKTGPIGTRVCSEALLFSRRFGSNLFFAQPLGNISIKIDTTKEFATDQNLDYTDSVGALPATAC
jgi:hypothetical protein